MKKTTKLFILFLFSILKITAQDLTIRTEEIRIRDPFIFVDSISKTYYMYAQCQNKISRDKTKQGVEVYKSRDLQTWKGPKMVYLVPDKFWAPNGVWAPEVHFYDGKYYLFTTFLVGKNKRKGSQILVSDSPDGQFKPFSNKPHTPKKWLCLDGTFWEEDGYPYMVFCHEWVQVTDGTIELIALKKDLSKTKGKPKTLFNASSAKWVRNLSEISSRPDGYVTDGCFLYKTKTGNLMMIWSSFGDEQYAVGMAISESGKIAGPWKHLDEPLFKANGGHGMIFKTLEGKLMLVLHQPNNSPNERAYFFEIEDMGDKLMLKTKSKFESITN